MFFKRAAILFAILLAASISLAGVARAQALDGSIRGRVTDPSGAVIPGVTITATSVETGISNNVTTDANGDYSFLQLAIGDYTVRAAKAGFQAFQAMHLHLTVNQVYDLPIQLKVGEVSSTVTVEANPAQVNTTSAQLGTVINSQYIVNIPLIGRNWVQLQQMQPGVVSAADGRGDFSTNGSETQQNSYLINGTDTNDLPLNTPLIIPSPDAIQEFRMVTNVINPEYGRNSGAVINAVTKSGTNQFHGDVFEFYRDPFLNARNFFSKTPAVFHQNEFGGTVGGPIWKNHTFFFFSYQGIRNRQPQAGAGNTHVFTPAEATGDFSAEIANLAATDTSPFPLFGDAASPCPATGGGPCPAGSSYASLFSTGIVPAADVNPISAQLQAQFVPLPNAGDNFQFNPVSANDTNQYMGRIDQKLGANDSLWGEWFWQHNTRLQTLPFTGANLPGFGSIDTATDNQGTISWTHILNEHMVNELRGGYTRLNFDAVEPQTSILPSSFCASNPSYVGGGGTMCFNITPQNTASAGLPKMTVQGLFTLGFSNNGPQPRIDQTYQATDNFSFTMGHHTMKAGFDMRRFQVSNPFFSSNNGNFSFQNTNLPFGTGISGLDFLLGIPTSYTQGSGATIDARSQEYYSYLQDEFKARPNLTLTYGVGWQIDTPLNDLFAHGHGQINFNPFLQSTLFPTAPLGVVYQGDPHVHAAGRTYAFRNFGPRIGFAYSPGWGSWFTGGPGKTSIRGGYGIYFNRSEEEQTLQTLTAPPFSTTSTGAGALVGGVPGFANPFAEVNNPSAVVPNPFPFSPPLPSPTLDFSAFEPIYTGIAFQDQATVDPMAENFNLTLERQVSTSSIFSIGYVGAVAHHLTLGLPLNTPISPDAVFNYCATVGTGCGPAADLNLWQNAPASLFRFDPLVYGPIDDITTTGNSRYNALQMSWNKHMSHGLQFLVGYTYSHSIDNTSGFEASSFGGGGFGALALERAANPFCAACDYGNSIFDARHRLVISYLYKVPNLTHMSYFHHLPSRIFDGWIWSGVTTFQSGFPLDVVDNNLGSGFCMFQLSDFACPDAPDIAGKVRFGDPRSFAPLVPVNEGGDGVTTVPNAWFDGSAFAQEATGTLGNLGRNSLRGPGINNFDMGLYKDTKITESTMLELRIEFYNVFNHTQFDPGGIDNGFGDGSTFGEEFSAFAPREIQLAGKFYF